jgi:tetratricopeptide (TPR) repeat protein
LCFFKSSILVGWINTIFYTFDKNPFKMIKRKKVFFFGMAVSGTIILLFLCKLLIDTPFSRAIPINPDLQSLSVPLHEQISTASKKARFHPTSDNIGSLGMVYHSCAQYDNAVKCYELAIKKDKSAWVWRYYLGYLNQEMGESEKSISNFLATLKYNPKAEHAWFYIGESYMKMGINNKAEEAFGKIGFRSTGSRYVKTTRVNYFSLREDAKFQLARIYLNTNRIDQAIQVLTRIVTDFHTYSPVYRLLGNAYQMKGDSLQGKKFIVRAKDQADFTPLLDTLVDKLAIISRSELYLPKQIDEAINSANPEWAERLLNNGIKYIPDDKYLMAKAITFYLRMNIGKKALPYLDKYLNLSKDNYHELDQVADLLFVKGFYSQAIRYYTHEILLKPQENGIRNRIALCNLQSGKKDTALLQINELVLRNPGNPEVLADAAEFMIMLGDKEKTQKFLANLEDIDPSYSRIHRLKGRIAEKEGNSGLAVLHYKAAFKDDPKDLPTVQSLCKILLDQKLWGESVIFIKQALAVHPNEPFLLERMGALLVSCPDPKQRNVEEGEEYCERAFYNIASEPETLISAGRNLVQAYAMMENFAAAKFYLNITLSMARSENLPAAYIQGLVNLGKKIEHYSH